MPESVTILKAKYVDLTEILQIQKAAFVSEAELYDNYNIEPLTQTIESIQADCEEYTFLKAVCEDMIVGSVKTRTNEDSCWIGKLIVKPEFQKKGIGRKLLIEVEAIFPLVKRFHLFTGAKSVGNIRLYESAGYEKVREFCDEKNPGVILIEMIKEKK